MGNTILSGVDLVYLPRFKQALKKGGQQFLHRVFHERELTGGGEDIPHLAGIFAAKEAVIKALSLPVDSFHDINVSHEPSGKPVVEITNYNLPITHYSISISHDGDYVIAQFVACLPAGRHW